MKKNNIIFGYEAEHNESFGKSLAHLVYRNKLGKTKKFRGFSLWPSMMGKAGILLPLILLLSGCLAPPIIPPDAELKNISSLLIVPVEAPPLEIIPDPIYDRIPAYRHFNNMLLPLPFLSETVYQNQAGVNIAGMLSPDEPYLEVERIGPKAGSLAPLEMVEQTWMPTRVLAQQAVSQLNKAKVNAILSDRFYRLPIINDNHTANLKGWRDAILEWYGLNQAAVDYHQTSKNSVDAIVEIAISNSRVFESQTSLQVFLKLIDSKTGRVLARSVEHGYVVGNKALSLFKSDSEPFKQLITDMGAGLLRDGFHNIGLLQKST